MLTHVPLPGGPGGGGEGEGGGGAVKVKVQPVRGPQSTQSVHAEQDAYSELPERIARR